MFQKQYINLDAIGSTIYLAETFLGRMFQNPTLRISSARKLSLSLAETFVAKMFQNYVCAINPETNHELFSKVSSEAEPEAEPVSVIEAYVQIQLPDVPTMLINKDTDTTVIYIIS